MACITPARSPDTYDRRKYRAGSVAASPSQSSMLDDGFDDNRHDTRRNSAIPSPLFSGQNTDQVSCRDSPHFALKHPKSILKIDARRP
jgi:hypothetical protein